LVTKSWVNAPAMLLDAVQLEDDGRLDVDKVGICRVARKRKVVTVLIDDNRLSAGALYGHHAEGRLGGWPGWTTLRASGCESVA